MTKATQQQNSPNPINIMDIEIFQQIIAAIEQPDRDDTSYRQLSGEIETMLDGEIEILLAEMQNRPEAIANPDCEPALEFVLGTLVGRQRKERSAGESSELNLNSVLASIKSIYLGLDEKSNARNYLLAWLATFENKLSVELFVMLIVEHPPKHGRGIVVAFQPFFDERATTALAAFPGILDAIQHVEMAAAVLDLGNYLSRESLVELHPASDRRASLNAMLQALTFQLGQIEKGQLPPDADPETISEQVDNCVALIVALCDALALIGDESAIPKLNDAMELKHRRIQTEAAAALFRLGEENGKEKMLEMLDEPVTRLRIVNYAEELGFSEEIDESFLTEEKRAESQLALWLAQPSQMGFAPSKVSVIDRRALHWPGFDNLIECFLLEYQFTSAAGNFQNIGITGPMTYVFAADLSHLNRFDQYAAFAGWQAAHDDLFEIPYEKACVAYRRDTELRLRDIENDGYLEIEPLFLGSFFGEFVLVCDAVKDGKSGQVLSDGEQINWWDGCSEEAPICGELAYCIYKGRRLLTHFNPQMDENLEEMG